MTRRVYIREIYLYIVCVIAIIVFIVGIITIYDGSFNYIKPATYLSRPQIITMYSEQYQDLSAGAIEQLADEELNSSLQIERNIAFKNMLRGILLIIIAIPLFIFHWIKAQKIWHKNSENSNK